MSSVEQDREIEALSRKLREEKTPSPADFRKLYELIGRSMSERYGAGVGHNPCSIETVSEVLLQLFQEIPPGRVLNVGLGGYPVVDRELERRGFSVVGVEYAESLTRLARDFFLKSKAKTHCLVGDGMKLPVRREAFEACLCSETLEHLPDDHVAVREIHRILKPEGLLVLTVPCLVSLHGFEKRLANFFTKGSWILHPQHLREYTFFSAKKLVDPYFKILRWAPVPFTTKKFSEMPYERLLSEIVSLPGMKFFSLSIALVLKKK